jgi:hypothetical protein
MSASFRPNVCRADSLGTWLLIAQLLGACNAGPPSNEASKPERELARSAAAASAAATSSAGVPSPAGVAPSAPAPALPVGVPAPDDFRYPASERVIAIGDLHGDLAASRAALRLGGAIDADDRWVGGTLTVVQTGDEIDRGDEDRDILDLFERLAVSARAAGGRVIALNGNHEVMNVQGDFRYVTPGAVSPFAGVTPRSPLAKGARPEFADRAAAFLPEGGYALKLAERDVIAVVGDSAFVHGGLLPEHVRYGISRLNHEVRAWMKAGPAAAPQAISNERGPVWLRDYALDPVSAETCAVLEQALSGLGVRRLVVGHTTQKTGITSACGDRVYRIDVGLARFYGGPLQVLEIKGGVVRVLRGQR